MSIQGGLWQALVRGESIGCTAIQIFTKSNRQWATKPLDETEVERFKVTWQQTNILSVVAHASYLINIASPSEATRNKSVHALIEELNRCSQLFIPYLILHPGSRGTDSVNTAITNSINQINIALESTADNTAILLETMAGQGSSLCNQFEEIAIILDAFKGTPRVGVCLDTCHIFAAGYDFRTANTYHQTWGLFDKIIGKKHLKAIHLNDSKKDLGSHVDRHEEIGQGKIGIEAFSLIMNDKSLVSIPKILETPKDTLHEYEHNMNILKGLIS